MELALAAWGKKVPCKSQIWKADSRNWKWPSDPPAHVLQSHRGWAQSCSGVYLSKAKADEPCVVCLLNQQRLSSSPLFLFQMDQRVFLHEEGCEGWTIMDFSDQLCFRKLLTVLHRFLKTLFIMKSTKTIFAISSIRCIKPLNSSSSCSPEQVYFSKKQKQQKKNTKKNKDFYQI